MIFAGVLATMTAVGAAAQVKVNAGLGTPCLLADKRQSAYLKVSLTGIPFETSAKRAPVNLSIVLDRSGSMTGEKIEQAKRAAILALDSVSSDDVVSVVIYDDSVDVIVPATKATDKEAIRQKIRRITPGGSTALFAGVSKGAEELRKFLDRERVNRIILLSDGLANVGPSSPASLGELGTSLAKDGMAVSTIGLGLDFNEDLMTRLSSNSGGSHYFAERATDLAQVFEKELGRALSVVAQETSIRIECAPNVRPIRVLNRDAEISGNVVTVSLDHIYADSEKYLVLEVEVPPTSKDTDLAIADVRTSYKSMATKEKEESSRKVVARMVASPGEVEAKTDKKIMEDVVEQVAVEKRSLAMKLRDEGKLGEAQAAMSSNQAFIDSNAAKYKSSKLSKYSLDNKMDTQQMQQGDWNRQRKSMNERNDWAMHQ